MIYFVFPRTDIPLGGVNNNHLDCPASYSWKNLILLPHYATVQIFNYV